IRVRLSYSATSQMLRMARICTHSSGMVLNLPPGPQTTPQATLGQLWEPSLLAKNDDAVYLIDLID
ncbi:hypothetical protein, partial [Pseudomonas quasicaspiana]|uniref:hypothetical protein n=1 Tax=Pseudomonas quasicaspiana TaxID=2829821 RepID=UPI001E2ED0B1